MTTVSFSGLDNIGRAIGPANLTGEEIPNSQPSAPPVHRQPMTEAEFLGHSFQDKVFDANVRLGAVNTALGRLKSDTSAADIVAYADVLAQFVMDGVVPEGTTRPTLAVVSPLHGQGAKIMQPSVAAIAEALATSEGTNGENEHPDVRGLVEEEPPIPDPNCHVVLGPITF